MSSPSETTATTILDKSETSPTKQQHTFAQAQFVTSVNRDCGTSAAAANIGEIIQEEEEEEEEEREEIKQQQNSKFILEPVILTDDDCNRTNITNKSNENEIILAGGLFTVNKIINDNKQKEEPNLITTSPPPPPPNNNNSNDQATTTNKEDSNETVEIRVEEGYATRQMDEYFRQTIAAIKEELTKKLNNEKKADKFNNQKRNRYDNDEIDEFNSDSDEDEFDSYFDSNDSDQFNDVDVDDPEKPPQQQNQTKVKKSNTYRLNNNQLYNHLINSKLNESNKKTLYEQIASWLVIFGCILNQFIIDGFCFNYANLFDLIQIDLNVESRLISSMPIALLICFYLMFAPVSIFLTKTYGSRRIALVGSFISSISLLISSFIRNIIVFTLFYGIFTGIGLSLIYIPSLISISKWFLKKRLLINSFTVLGACLGAATYPLISEYLIKKYNLFGALLILSGIQLNCFVGSMLLREPSIPLSSVFNRLKLKKHKQQNENEIIASSVSKSKKSHNLKKRSASSTFLIEKEEEINSSTSKKSNDIEMVSSPSFNNNNNNTNNKQKQRRKQQQIKRKLDSSETESTTSTSTATITNYTLKQYWRKFVQTRKSQANTKKNLFHLIAEEKKKTRTLSKTSLEDGFVITTSNNLLAPNDESHVIVSSRQVKLSQTSSPQTNQQPQQQPPISRTASKFFTRIANSIRSLTTHNSNQSPLHTTNNSKNHLDIRTTTTTTTSPLAQDLNEIKLVNKVVQINDAKMDSPSNVKKNQEQTTPLPLIPLMSVFSGPLPESIQNNNSNNNNTSAPELENSLQIPTIQLNESTSISDTSAVSNTNNVPSNPIFNDEIHDFDDDDDLEEDDDYEYDYDENEQDDDKEIQAHKKNLRKIVRKNANSNVYKMNRYFSYRNSLTSSVRGSLMECSVPEDREETMINSANGDLINDEENDEDNSKENTNLNQNKRMSIQRKKRLQRLFEANLKQNSNSLASTGGGGGGGQSKNNNKKADNINLDGRNSKNFRMASARRFISTIESSSFFNLPINLETTENNIKNSFITRNKNNHKRLQNKSVSFFYNNNNNNTDNTNTSTLLLLYLGYVTNFKLFLNPLLMILNFSFFLNIIGICVPLIYISEFCKSQGITKIQSIYMLALIGLSQGVGRVLATILFKVNESDAKSRIFTHDLTLILAGLSVLLSTVLCDSLLSCSVFSITFGTLYGFNANLRSLFIYDIIGLEWSDDSLFCCISLAQAVGASVGIPIAGLIYDMTKSYLNVFYFSGVCLIFSGLMLTPGRNFRNSCNGSIKRFNKYYFQRK